MSGKIDMRGTMPGLIAAISLSLAMAQATLAAQAGCNDGQRPFATAGQGELRSTYEMIWLDGVARAPDQIAATNIATGTSSVVSNGAWFHYGAFFGLEYYR